MKFTKYLVIILLISNSCSTKKPVIRYNDVYMYIKTEPTGKDIFCSDNDLKMSFIIIKKKYKFIFNIRDLDFNCANYEKTDYGIFKDLDNVSRKIKKSHFIIENNLKEFKLFNEKGEAFRNYTQMCPFKDTYDHNFFKKNKTIYRDTTFICLNHLLIRKEDKQIRLWYLFKPNSTQIKKGYKEALIKSNWIKIKN